MRRGGPDILAHKIRLDHSPKPTDVTGLASRNKGITRLSQTSRCANPSGYLVSVLGVDCMQLSMSILQVPSQVVGVLFMPLMVYLLAARVGTDPALCCAAWMVGSLLLVIPVARLQNAIWRRIMAYRDERLKRLSDLLSSVRLVKMYAWEDACTDAVDRLRRKEMLPIFLINLLDGFIDSLYSASSSVMLIIVFGSLAILDPSRTLDASLSFSVIYIISLNDLLMVILAQFMRIRSMVKTSLVKRATVIVKKQEVTVLGGVKLPPKIKFVLNHQPKFNEEPGMAPSCQIVTEYKLKLRLTSDKEKEFVVAPVALYGVDTRQAIDKNFKQVNLGSLTKVSLGIGRIAKLCSEEEQEESPGESRALHGTGEILLSDCSFVWTKRREGLSDPTLKSVSLEIAPGSLVGLAGFVGSGKSSLLAAILGDMHCVEGTITTS
ncbi:hypothetical protein HPB47_003795, partial [Ixodes persulcatus]